METIQNILTFGVASAILEPPWDRNQVESVRITMAEAIGGAHRAGTCDQERHTPTQP